MQPTIWFLKQMRIFRYTPLHHIITLQSANSFSGFFCSILFLSFLHQLQHFPASSLSSQPHPRDREITGHLGKTAVCGETKSCPRATRTSPLPLSTTCVSSSSQLNTWQTRRQKYHLWCSATPKRLGPWHPLLLEDDVSPAADALVFFFALALDVCFRWTWINSNP